MKSNKVPLGYQIDDHSFLVEYRFSYKQFREIVGVNGNTLRTWLRRFLPGIGKKKESGRMLYSGLDCIYVNYFSELITRLGVTPSASKIISKVIHDLAFSVTCDFEGEKAAEEDFEPMYVVFSDIYDDEISTYIVPESYLPNLFTLDRKLPSLVVSDAIYWSTLVQVYNMTYPENKLIDEQ